MVQQGAEQKGAGLGEDDYTALPAPLARAIATSFRGIFHFSFGPSEIGSDAMLGRARREMERRQPTLHDILRLKRLVETRSRPTSKRRRLGHGLELVDAPDTEATATLVHHGENLFSFMESHSALMNTLAHAGVLEFTPRGAAAAMRYADFVVIRQYSARCRVACARALSSGVSEAETLALFKTTDRAFREKWIELIRGDPELQCYTTAITTTLTSMEPLWQWENGDLHRRSSPNGPRESTPERKRSAPGGEEAVTPAKAPRTAKTATAKGKEVDLCKHWNDPRGCATPCSRNKTHACDVLVTKDRACGQNHRRGQHTGPVFGYVN